MVIITPLMVTNLVIYLTIIMYGVLSKVGKVEVYKVLLSSMLIVALVLPMVIYVDFLISILVSLGIRNVIIGFLIILNIFYGIEDAVSNKKKEKRHIED